MTKKLPVMLCRWNAFEQEAHKIFYEFESGQYDALTALYMLDFLIGATTGRGYSMTDPGEVLPAHLEAREDTIWDAYE